MADPISWIAAKAAEWVAMAAFQAATATGVSITTAATIANVAYAATFALVYVGAAVGLSSLVSPKVPNAEQGKMPVNQTTPKRRIGTGRSRLSGPRALWESLPGWNVEIINVLDQPIDAFEQFWLNDDAVTVDGDGWVQRLNGAYGDQEIRILAKTGQPGDDGAFEELVAMFAAAGLSDLYDDSHVGEGVARMALVCKAIDAKYVLDVYPNGPPALSATVRLCRVYDWRDADQDLMDPATWKWSANAHVNHVHWEWCLRHLPRIGRDGVGWVQGKGVGSAAPPPPICLEDWYGDHAPRLAERTAVADLCDERVALAAGGDEARYEQHGWWEIGTEDADVRAQYLICYDGWMAEGGDGALIIKGGKYEPPPADVVLTDRNLVEASWNRGAPDKDVYNIIKATFTSRAHGYSPQPADDWRDEDLIAEVGDEKPLPIDLGWVQSHGQARRLMKRMTPRVFADRHGDLAADLDGLNHIRRRYGRLERKRGPTSMRSVDFELLGASIDLRGGRVPLNIVKADPNIDVWNPVTEEGLGPSLTERAPSIQIPMPEVVSITPVTVSIGDANGVRLRFVIEDPGRPGLSFAIRWRAAGAVSWTEGSPQPPTAVSGGLQVESGFVQAGDLEASISAWSGVYRSDWTLEADVSAEPEPDPEVVSAPSNLIVSSPSAGVLRVDYRDPSQPVAYCIVRTNVTASLTGATATPERPVGGVYTPQSVDLSRAAGSYYVWVTAYNADDVPSAHVGPAGPVVVS
ncbi:phage tail protein [Brevundimonas phoenicis]|uniref:hypothetical protein n=1 Tax=unclassified Brevundimonas TaxID=2622653 RepID=UPI0039A0E7FE